MAAVNARWTVCDPVHRILDFGSEPTVRDTVKQLVGTPAFQRLRRVSQLGLAGHVFPGATHSRFAHCLGAAYLARVLVQHLRESADLRRSSELSDNEQQIVTAALLHDIGHGPFSHAFEAVLEGVANVKVKHEAWTKAIILGPLRPVLEANMMNAEGLATNFFDRSPKKLPAYIRQIVSSQLDVDRMDYLVRDAHFSGVPLGNIDLHYLIRSIAIVEHGANHATLGLAHKGVRAYEAFALSRHHMNRTVYYHAKVAVLELMLEKCLVEMAEAIARQEQPVNGLPASLCRLLSAGNMSALDKFIESNLDSYLEITEDHVWTALSFVSRSWSGRARDLAQGLLERKLLPYFHVQHGKSAEMAAVLDNAGFGPRDYCIRHKKSKVYGDGASDDDAVVHVAEDDDRSEAVTSHSFMLKAFANKPEIETLLVVLDLKKTQSILEAARQSLSRSRPHGSPEAGLKNSLGNGAGDATAELHVQSDEQSVF